MMKKEYTEFTEYYIKFTRERITKMLMDLNISEHKLSKDLGNSGSYINGITSGRSLSAFDEFLYMCELLHITPHEFFDEENHEPMLIQELTTVANKLDDDDLRFLITMAEKLNRQ